MNRTYRSRGAVCRSIRKRGLTP